MRSTSSLYIDWLRPELETERWEFFSHPAKQPFYQRHDLNWEQLTAATEQGTLVPWPRSDRLGEIPVQLAYHQYDDYLTFLAKAKRNYRLNYNRLETDLQREGRLTLPAPMVLVCHGEALLFSGYRRLCLAWNYGMIPYVWRITLD